MERNNKTPEPAEVLSDVAVKVLREYYEKTEQVECTDGFFSEFLYFMNAGEEGHSTNAIYYQFCISRVLKALANPQVSGALSGAMERDYDLFIEMISRLQYFMKKMELYDHYEALIESHYIELYGRSENEKSIRYQLEKTELQLAALRARHPEKKL